jgi:protein-disulfide isomerase
MKKNQPKNTISKQTATIIIIVTAVLLIAGVRFFKWGQGGAGESARARVAGNPKASLRIVEFVDLQCPACAVGAADLKKYLAAFPEVKFFPLGGHMHSLIATKYTECAARQGKFWPYFDLVFERQARWRDLFDAHPVFDEIAKEVGLNDGQLRACLDSDEVREKILSEKDEGASRGVKSTPTYFINDKMVVGPKLMREEVEKTLGVKTESAPATVPAP